MRFFFILLIVMISPSSAEQQPLRELLSPAVLETPKVYPEPAQDVGSVKGLFYQTLPYKGQETRAFAYYGIPESETPVPAMVLVHGGGGKAFHEWVKIWNDRGYAAISMSLEGHMPNEEGEGKVTHEHSGPQRVGRFGDGDLALEKQWMYHAVSDILLAHSLLRAEPKIDKERIGVTGISWGGILSSLVSGVDDRFKCAIPVYGAGFLYESLGHFKTVQKESQKFWDPARQFKDGHMPTLWVNGDRDGHFSINITSKSHAITADHSQLVIHPSMKHGHPPGWDPVKVPEIYAFTDAIFKGGTPLGKITTQPAGLKMELSYESEEEITEATVHYLETPLSYRKSAENPKHTAPGQWKTFPASVNSTLKTVSAELPDTVMTYYVNLKDSRGCLVSSQLAEIK